MATLKCKKCGGNLEIIDPSSSLCECEYCGSKETLPTIDDEKIMKMYERANRLRMANEFDKAASVYESIVDESDTEAEAYWGLVLCKYGIEYVDDPATGDKIPTCHRLSFDDVMEDSDFEMVMENADMEARNIYRENAKQIENIRRGIIEISDKEEPYDIFICYKETDENGDRTIDSVMAQEVYDALVEKGYRVFFSRITLEDKLGQEYEPYIFAALNSAKVMLVFGTEYDYYNAVWVRNEWSRYLSLMAKDKSKKLIPCYKNIDAYDIPKEFKHLQAQDMGKVGAEQDLIRGIDKILKSNDSENETSTNNLNTTNVQELQEAVANAVVANSGNNANALLERGFMTLEDGEFDKADQLFEDVLNQNPKCAEAYMGKIWAYYKLRNTKEFVEKIYSKAIRRFKIEQLKPDYNIREIVKEKYALSDKMSEDVLDRVEGELLKKRKYITVINSLNEYDSTKDYIECLCSCTDEDTKKVMPIYARFKQYATDEILEKYSVKESLDELVDKNKQKDTKRIEDINRTYSKEGFLDIIKEANVKIRESVGDELDKVEEEYKRGLKEWKEKEENKQAIYEKECQKIKENWPAKRIEIQNNWKAECDRLTNEYNEAKEKYENEKKEIDEEISSLNMELSKCGLFKGKQKKILKDKIEELEVKKNKKMEDLQLPQQPEDLEEPIYPEKPIPEDKPKRKDIDSKEDGIEILCEILKKKHINPASILKVYKTITMGLGPDKKPIEWIIIKEEENRALLLSKYIIDVRQWDKDNDRTAYWNHCDLRRYLNGEFIENTFSNEEKNKILEVKLKTEENAEFDEKEERKMSDSVDKVFCLSMGEVEEYFDFRIFKRDEDYFEFATGYGDFKNLMGIPTEYAKKNEHWNDTNIWWLRAYKNMKGNYSDFHNAFFLKVTEEDFVWVHDERVKNYYGIRPALWIEL